MQPAIPRPLLYLLIALLAAAGIGAGVRLAISGFDDLQRISAPGERRLRLPRAGTYTLFYESRSRLDGTTYDTGSAVPTMSAALVSARGEIVPLERSRARTKYSFGPYRGVSTGRFEVSHAGMYTLRTSYTSGGGDDIVLAIAPSMVASIGGGIALAILSLLGGIFAAVFVHSRTRQRVTTWTNNQAPSRPTPPRA